MKAKAFVKLTGLIFLLNIILISCSNEDELEKITPFTPTDAEIVREIPYAVAKDTAGVNVELVMDLFKPAKTYSNQTFPVVLMIHAGSYLVGKKEWIEPRAKILSDSGFITASITYRQGWRSNGGCAGTINSLREAEYRAIQDANAALRYLVYNAKNLSIDTSRIYICGESAGATIALNCSYTNDYIMMYKNPELYDKLGGLNNSGNNLPAKYSIKGICSKYGSISDSGYINVHNKIPTICFHGTNDQLVPCNSGYFLGCTSVPAFGSNWIYNRLVALEGNSVCILKQDGSHMPPEFSPEYTMRKTIEFFHTIENGTITSYRIIE